MIRDLLEKIGKIAKAQVGLNVSCYLIRESRLQSILEFGMQCILILKSTPTLWRVFRPITYIFASTTPQYINYSYVFFFPFLIKLKQSFFISRISIVGTSETSISNQTQETSVSNQTQHCLFKQNQLPKEAIIQNFEYPSFYSRVSIRSLK